jgi:hypothetical protein
LLMNHVAMLKRWQHTPSGRRGFGTTGWSKPQEVTDAICEALKRNFVFKGIPESLLLEVGHAGCRPTHGWSISERRSLILPLPGVNA